MERVSQEVIPPPTGWGRYQSIIDTLKANPGEWFRVSPEEVAGDTVRIRRKALYSAALYRGLKVQSRSDGECFFVRMIARKRESNGN